MSARTLFLPALAALVLVSSGCATAGPPAVRQAASAGTAAEGRTSYPLTIRDCGQNYTFAKAPSRVVVMNGGSVAEVSSLLELGLGNRIIANAQNYGASEVDGRAAAITALPTGGVTRNSLQDIPREEMLALHPDLVISTYAGGFSASAGFATRDDLLRIGANSYVPAIGCGSTGTVTGTPTIEDSYAMLRDFGQIFDVPDAAERVIDASRATIAAVATRTKGLPAKKVMVIFSGKDGADLNYVAGNGIWNDILAKAGAVNAFAGATNRTFASIGPERAAAAQVDALVVVDYLDPDPRATADSLFQRFPQWQASKYHRALVLSDSVYLGPSNDIAVTRIARLVHPEAF